mmetsp:Transcript_1444/g.3804  ORF Transcript_1444/g.3804 Transcript_1444/m.3804 type:complete len:208 (-) Transcript_1444:1036-1659(-)
MSWRRARPIHPPDLVRGRGVRRRTRLLDVLLVLVRLGVDVLWAALAPAAGGPRVDAPEVRCQPRERVRSVLDPRPILAGAPEDRVLVQQHLAARISSTEALWVCGRRQPRNVRHDEGHCDVVRPGDVVVHEVEDAPESWAKDVAEVVAVQEAERRQHHVGLKVREAFEVVRHGVSIAERVEARRRLHAARLLRQVGSVAPEASNLAV